MNKTVKVFIILTFGARAYLQRTANIRGDTRNLLIGLQRPHNAVTKDTVARWVKTALCRADIDLKLFQAHSVRAAAGSAGFRKQVPLHTLLRTAGWTQESTFRKHYNLPLAMATYMSFPVGIFYYFNQPSFFEGWMMKERHKLFPPEDPKVNILLKRQKDAMETKREAQWIK